MFGKYLAGLKKTIDLLHEAEKKPMESGPLWLAMQERLIVQLTDTENRIRGARAEIKRIKNELTKKHPKLVAGQLKKGIKQQEVRIETNEKLLFVYRSIGDAMAYTFISRHDIKPMSEKQHAGFISNKKGSRFERRMLRYTFKAGGIAILNDLTNYLRYFDLTVIKDHDVWFPIELKSSKSLAKNPRVQRQMEAGGTLLKYLLDDEPMAVPGMQDAQRIRLSQTSKTKHYISQLNEYIATARSSGSHFGKPEKGLVYWVGSRFEPPEDALKGFRSAPHLLSLNEHKFIEIACLPLVKIFQRTEDYLSFLQGEFVVMMALDTEPMKAYALKRGYDMLPADQPNFAFLFQPHIPDRPAFQISVPMFLRIFLECYSPKWFMKENLDFAEQQATPENLEALKFKSDHEI